MAGYSVTQLLQQPDLRGLIFAHLQGHTTPDGRKWEPSCLREVCKAWGVICEEEEHGQQVRRVYARHMVKINHFSPWFSGVAGLARSRFCQPAPALRELSLDAQLEVDINSIDCGSHDAKLDMCAEVARDATAVLNSMLLRAAPNLRRLHLEIFHSHVPSLSKFLAGSPKLLTSLSLSFKDDYLQEHFAEYEVEGCLEAFVAAIRSFLALQDLTVRGLPVGACERFDLTPIAAALPPSLSSLDIEHPICSGAGDEGIETLQRLGRLPQLRSLRLMANILNVDQVLPPTFASLARLHLGMDDRFVSFEPGLSCLTNLRSLEVALRDGGWAEALSTLRQLTFLSLNITHNEAGGCYGARLDLSPFTQLQILGIFSGLFGYDDEAPPYMGPRCFHCQLPRGLAALTRLRHLGCFWCHLEELQQAAPALLSLTKLHLWHSFTAAGPLGAVDLRALPALRLLRTCCMQTVPLQLRPGVCRDDLHMVDRGWGRKTVVDEDG